MKRISEKIRVVQFIVSLLVEKYLYFTVFSRYLWTTRSTSLTNDIILVGLVLDPARIDLKPGEQPGAWARTYADKGFDWKTFSFVGNKQFCWFSTNIAAYRITKCMWIFCQFLYRGLLHSSLSS